MGVVMSSGSGQSATQLGRLVEMAKAWYVLNVTHAYESTVLAAYAKFLPSPSSITGAASTVYMSLTAEAPMLALRDFG